MIHYLFTQGSESIQLTLHRTVSMIDSALYLIKYLCVMTLWSQSFVVSQIIRSYLFEKHFLVVGHAHMRIVSTSLEGIFTTLQCVCAHEHDLENLRLPVPDLHALGATRVAATCLLHVAGSISVHRSTHHACTPSKSV